MEYGVDSLVTPSHMAIDLRLLEKDMTKDMFGRYWWFFNGDEYYNCFNDYQY